MTTEKRMTTEKPKTLEEQMAALSPLAAEIISERELRRNIERSVESGEPLRIKQGIDPTTPDVHLGHMVPYRLMRRFQDCGHIAVLIIGDITARIGDPTGRDSERAALSEQEVRRNADTYTDQIFRVVDRSRAEVRRQSEWFVQMDLPRTLELLSEFSVAQMLAHQTFRERLDGGRRLSLHELVYPLLQAQDSVEVAADVEIGGSDQKFNMLCGRDLLRSYGRKPQVVVTTPLLPGTDGRKMSKSFGNHIPVTCSPVDMYGAVMSLADEWMPEFYQLATDTSPEHIRTVMRRLKDGAVHPRAVKAELASLIVTRYHGESTADAAAREFDRVLRDGGMPSTVSEVMVEDVSLPLASVLRDAGVVESAAEARRLIRQGGVTCGDVRVADPGAEVAQFLGSDGTTLVRVGKRRFVRLRHR